MSIEQQSFEASEAFFHIGAVVVTENEQAIFKAQQCVAVIDFMW